MDAKSKRLIAIKRIIRDSKIYSQEELLNVLTEEGITCTQATLSRDLKFLKVGKIPGENNKSMYTLPESSFKSSEERDKFISNGVISVEFSLNVAVIKTALAYSSVIAAAIDRVNPYEILGTVAGDDTIIVVLREGTTRKDFMSTLNMILLDT